MDIALPSIRIRGSSVRIATTRSSPVRQDCCRRTYSTGARKSKPSDCCAEFQSARLHCDHSNSFGDASRIPDSTRSATLFFQMRFDFIRKFAVDAMPADEIDQPPHLFTLCLE